MREIKAIIQPFMLQDVFHALAAMDALPGVTISEVTGWGKSRATDAPTGESFDEFQDVARIVLLLSPT